ncbi:MAG: energy transducer TonB [Bacteroidetes bacterium]|nr:energy transducer TonB [Bacteroidota bacterium]
MADSFLNKWESPESEDRLEMVFADRFKAYGAYFVRANYRKSKFIATLIACGAVTLFSAAPVILAKFKPKAQSGATTMRVEAKTLDDIEEEKEEQKEKEPPPPEPPEPVATQQYVAPTIDQDAAHDDIVLPASAVTTPGQRTQEGSNDIYGDDGSSSGTPFNDGNDDEIKAKVDKVADFPGGEEAFIQYVTQNFQYPPRCWEEGINGYVMLRFVVDTRGAISQVTSLEGTPSCPEFTTEAIRVLKASPRWVPAQYNGKFVKAWRQIPIRLSVE